jgi:hypothetical protein
LRKCDSGVTFAKLHTVKQKFSSELQVFREAAAIASNAVDVLVEIPYPI